MITAGLLISLCIGIRLAFSFGILKTDMGLSGEQIQQLQSLEATYEYRGNELQDMTLSCFVAPSRTGKSRLISEVVALATAEDGVGEVNTITTRARRPGEDPVDYRTADEGITHEWMLQQIAENKLVNFKSFPTGDIYDTDAASYPARHNLLPTIAESVPALARVAFRSVQAIYVVRPLADWKAAIGDDVDNPKFFGRIVEAKKSLEFARNTSGIIRVVNYADDELLKRTAAGLLEIVKSDHSTYRSDILEDYHDREFEIHQRDMENYVDELLRKAA